MPRFLTRLELSSGSRQTWASVGNEGWVQFLGVDSNGNPLVDLYTIPATSKGVLLVYTAPEVRVRIASVSVTPVGVNGRQGTWLAGDDGIYLLRSDHTLVKVSGVTGGNVAGGCN